MGAGNRRRISDRHTREKGCTASGSTVRRVLRYRRRQDRAPRGRPGPRGQKDLRQGPAQRQVPTAGGLRPPRRTRAAIWPARNPSPRGGTSTTPIDYPSPGETRSGSASFESLSPLPQPADDGFGDFGCPAEDLQHRLPRDRQPRQQPLLGGRLIEQLSNPPAQLLSPLPGRNLPPLELLRSRHHRRLHRRTPPRP